MFSGIIQRIGRVVSVSATAEGLRLAISPTTDAGRFPANSLARTADVGGAPAALDPFADVQPGESIAVNGVCLTVADIRMEGGGAGRTRDATGRTLLFDAVRETLERTTLRELTTGAAVNLERALRVGDHLGGHFVQGHVDGIGTVAMVVPVGNSKEMEISVPEELARQMIMKGSVAVDGVSLTISGLSRMSFRVVLVPHTLKTTTLGALRVGRKVNIETDMIGKWVFKALEGRTSADTFSAEKLRALGF